MVPNVVKFFALCPPRSFPWHPKPPPPCCPVCWASLRQCLVYSGEEDEEEGFGVLNGTIDGSWAPMYTARAQNARISTINIYCQCVWWWCRKWCLLFVLAEIKIIYIKTDELENQSVQKTINSSVDTLIQSVRGRRPRPPVMDSS